MTEAHPFTAEEQAAIAKLTKAPQLDINGEVFNPDIHAVKKDGNPKKTPQGAWAKLGVVDNTTATDPESKLDPIPAKPEEPQVKVKQGTDSLAAYVDDLPPLAPPEPDVILPPDLTDPADVASYKRIDAEIRDKNEALAKAALALSPKEFPVVLCYEHNGYRFTLPLDVAKQRLADGQIARYEQI